MNLKPQIRNVIIEIICMLFVLLFVYAAASKLLDFQHFKIQLGQSPLLSAFAGWLAVLVPLLELLICVLLIVPRYKLAGLFSAYGLVVMFTAYIFIILNYTSFIPCSCGGVLEKLDWKSHMLFNIVFVCLAAAAIVLHENRHRVKNYYKGSARLIGQFTIVTVSSISVVTILFMLSENIIHYHNKLTRRFPQSPIQQEAITDLKFNSFYIAGADSSAVYLGNLTAPLMVTILDNKLVQTQQGMINLNHTDLPFRAVKISVKPPYFFVTDGTVPCVFKGKTNDWKAKLVYKEGEYFTTAVAVDSSSIAVVTTDKVTGENVLGVIQTGSGKKTILNPEILQKQFDGVFDTDGQLHFSEGMNTIVYLYAYRNEFTIADKDLRIRGRGNTIDTISQAKLSIAKDKKHKQRKFSKPPLFVNKRSTVYNNLLFVHSAVPGLYEDDRMWKRTSVIDVYDLSQKSYVLSFTIIHLNDQKMKDFLVYNDQLYVLIGNHIIRYKLDGQITSKYRKININNLLAK